MYRHSNQSGTMEKSKQILEIPSAFLLPGLNFTPQFLSLLHPEWGAVVSSSHIVFAAASSSWGELFCFNIGHDLSLGQVPNFSNSYKCTCPSLKKNHLSWNWLWNKGENNSSKLFPYLFLFFSWMGKLLAEELKEERYFSVWSSCLFFFPLFFKLKTLDEKQHQSRLFITVLHFPIWNQSR